MRFFNRSAAVYWAWLGGGTLGLAWLIYSLSITPLQRRATEFQRTAADLRGRIASARHTIEETKKQEEAVASARAELQRIQGDLPTGSAMAWFPNRMKRHFDKLGIPDSATRLNTALNEPDMPDYERSYWAVDLPIRATTADMSKLLIAVAELEEAEPLVKVMDLAIRQDDDSGRRTAVINVTTLVRR